MDNQTTKKEHDNTEKLKEEALKIVNQEYEEPFNKEIIKALIMKEVSYDDVANELIKKKPIHYDENGLWWMWRRNKWQIVDETEILIAIKDAFEWSGVNSTATRNQFLKALQTESRRLRPKRPPKEWIQLNNTIINYQTGEEMEPTPEYLFTNPIPWNLGTTEDTPIMDKLISSWVKPENLQLAYEIIAYCLLRDYPIQRIITLIGSGSNGKGQFIGIIRKFLGFDNVTSSDLDRLSVARFEAAKLYKKLMCEIAETNVNVLKQTSTLKRLCGGDLLSCEFKNKNPFDFINYAKLIIASNSLPMTMDRTDGFYRRWLILEFPNKFKDGMSVIDTIPDEEFENLSRKLIRILKELMDRGSFLYESSIEARKAIYERFSNPIKTFINQFYERSFDGYTIKQEFNDALWNYLNDNGFRFLSANEINKALRSMGFEIKPKKVMDKSYKVIYGLVKKVTKVTEVTTSLPLYIEKNNKVGNTVTSVTSVTNIDESLIKKKILFIINSGAVDCNKESLILSIVAKRLNVSESDVMSVIKKLLDEGVIFEPRAGVYEMMSV